MTNDEKYMERCLDLAVKPEERVAPNPMVGSVIVHNDKIIGSGYHKKLGEAHAEINAIESIPKEFKKLITEATLYVNLEPCSHIGKTPPCTERIINEGIKEVVIGIGDPNPLVAGKGIEQLKKAGLNVRSDTLVEKCRYVNRRFLTFHEKKRPFIILKWAQTKDRFIASTDHNDLAQISNNRSRALVHSIRASEMGIMVGTNTVEIDNPSLTTRHWPGKNATRIIFDRHLRLDRKSHVFNEEADTILFTNDQPDLQKIAKDFPKNVEIVALDTSRADLTDVLKELYDRSIQSVLVEGGAQLIESFISDSLWDEAVIFTGTKEFTEGLLAPRINGEVIEEKMIEDDRMVHLIPTEVI